MPDARYPLCRSAITGWNSSLPLLCVDFDRHPDLAEQFGIVRAPALDLVHADDLVVWKQDEGLSDELLLDLKQAEIQIESLVQNP